MFFSKFYLFRREDVYNIRSTSIDSSVRDSRSIGSSIFNASLTKKIGLARLSHSNQAIRILRSAFQLSDEKPLDVSRVSGSSGSRIIELRGMCNRPRPFSERENQKCRQRTLAKQRREKILCATIGAWILQDGVFSTFTMLASRADSRTSWTIWLWSGCGVAILMRQDQIRLQPARERGTNFTLESSSANTWPSGSPRFFREHQALVPPPPPLILTALPSAVPRVPISPCVTSSAPVR